MEAVGGGSATAAVVGGGSEAAAAVGDGCGRRWLLRRRGLVRRWGRVSEWVECRVKGIGFTQERDGI